MSFGHRHHAAHGERLGERAYDRALRDVRFQAILARWFDVSYDYDVPYLGGYSRDGATIYIDKDTPHAIQRGRKVFPVRPNGLVAGILMHEHWEKTAMIAWGVGYDDAHELATHAEHHFMRERMGMEPDEYEALWAPIITFAERKLKLPGIALPPDLDMAPYQAGH